MEYIKNQNGVSLVEVVVGMVVLVITLGGIYQILTGMNRSQQYNLEAAANIEEQRAILNNIAIEVRNAVGLTVDEAGTMITYRRNGDAADRTISLDTDTHTVMITDPTGAAVRRYNLGRERQVHFDSEFDPDKGISKITIELRKVVTDGEPEKIISTVVYTLNKVN